MTIKDEHTCTSKNGRDVQEVENECMTSKASTTLKVST